MAPALFALLFGGERLHASVMAWAAGKVADLGLGGTVLEVGSLDVNGSLRPLFPRARYVGVDMRQGPGVDNRCLAGALPFGTGAFDVVVCTEMLEHDPSPWRSLPEMARVLRGGGHMLLSARGIGFPLHDFPSDYWRFTVDGICVLLDVAGLVAVEVVPDPDPGSPGVLAVARKP